jgi:hypothetical protein
MLFYVTVIRSSKQVGWLSGPYPFKDIAEQQVAIARRKACAIDPWCDFDLFGVTACDKNIKTVFGILPSPIMR